jgi:hypothetical protein
MLLPPTLLAGYAAAQASAVAEAISEAFTCSCQAGPATAQALSQAIAKAGGCKGGVSDALAGMLAHCICAHSIHASWCKVHADLLCKLQCIDKPASGLNAMHMHVCLHA